MTINHLPIWNEDHDSAQRFIEQALADLAAVEPAHRDRMLRSLFARVWQQGWDLCYEDGGKDWNPYSGQPVIL